MAVSHDGATAPVMLQDVESTIGPGNRGCSKPLRRRKKSRLSRARQLTLLSKRPLRKRRRVQPFYTRCLAGADLAVHGQEDALKDAQCTLKISDLPPPVSGCGQDAFADTVERDLQEVESQAVVGGEDTSDLSEELILDHILEVVNPLQYHTHKEEGIEVCSAFLLGCCFYGQHCPQHHTILPYHWQLFHISTQTWESVGGDAQEILERLYSDPAKVHIRASYQGVSLIIDLRSMLVWYSKDYLRVRRLSTSADPTVSFHTTYKYYYKDVSDWHECSMDFVQNIEEAKRQGVREAHCRTQLYQYIVDLLAGTQQNLTTGTQRPVCCRPVFCSPVLLLPQLRTLSGSGYLESSVQPTQLAASNTSSDQPYPETWLEVNVLQDFSQVPMSFEDRGYRLIYTFFHKTMPESKYVIVSIQRVQNCYLWDKYKRKKEHMSRKLSEQERLVNERHLFHGTSYLSIDAICKHNFDPRLSGKHATVYGQGSYFAKKAKYSHRYAPSAPSGAHYVFLSKVLVGKSTLGICTYRRPPAVIPDDPTSDLYDSCVDSIKDPQIYVIFDNDQCYPYFIIKYEEIKEVVCLD